MMLNQLYFRHKPGSSYKQIRAMASPLRLVSAAQQAPSPVIFVPVIANSTTQYMESIAKLNGLFPTNSGSNYYQQEQANSQPHYSYQTIHPVVRRRPPRTRYRPPRSEPQTSSSSLSSYLFPWKKLDHNNHWESNKKNGHNINRRDGWGGGSGNKQSPAISALALLGFLFFLNMIQNSLLNNIYLLTSRRVPRNGTVLGSNIAFGRSGRLRSSHLMWGTEKEMSEISGSMADRILPKQIRKKRPRHITSFKDMFISFLRQEYFTKINEITCEMGKSLIRMYPEPASVYQMIAKITRKFFRPKRARGTRTNWIGQLLKSLTRTWRKGRGMRTRKCAPTARKKRKAFRKFGAMNNKMNAIN